MTLAGVTVTQNTRGDPIWWWPGYGGIVPRQLLVPDTSQMVDDHLGHWVSASFISILSLWPGIIIVVYVIWWLRGREAILSIEMTADSTRGIIRGLLSIISLKKMAKKDDCNRKPDSQSTGTSPWICNLDLGFISLGISLMNSGWLRVTKWTTYYHSKS